LRSFPAHRRRRPCSLTHAPPSPLQNPQPKTTAYGQTGSGKTHTLIGALGDGEEGAGAGVVPRACRLLLQRLAAAEATGAPTTATATTTPIITMTVVEIYAERVRCLLGGGQNLPLKQEAGSVSGGGVRAEGAVEVSVPAPASSASASSARDPTSSLRTLQRALQRALSQRAVAATDMNQASSRSHCVVMLRLPRTGAKLCLVDLAGSERAGRTNAQGTALAEGAAINKSLSALAGVVSALAGVGGGGGGGDDGEAQAPQPQPQQQQGQQQQQHVPYRDSKLTRLLQDSLGGSARTVLLVCCSPARRDGGETLSSLRFASRARGVKCLVAPVGAAGITGVGEAGTAALLAAEVARLKARLREMGEGAGAATVVAAPPSKPLLPWLLRCASAAVLGAYLAWEGMVW
jgi:hypothetical protein